VCRLLGVSPKNYTNIVSQYLIDGSISSSGLGGGRGGHCNRSDDSLWDPSDNLDIPFGKSKHKGRRYCFAAVLQGPDPLVDNPKITSEVAGLVPGTVWAFCPQQKRSHQGDYHKVFNGENFVAWWKDQLLPNLHQHSLIHMDNAAYHKLYGSHVPKWGKLRKQECIDFLLSKGFEVEARCPAVVVKARTKEWILANEKFECVRLAEEQGHKALFTPPYHSDHQSIELTWARIKDNIGRQDSVGTTLALVHERLLHEFKNLEESGHGAIQGMINKCVRIAKTFYDDMPEEELAE
jgi:transposase